MKRKLRVRRDPYHGWRMYWQGCPNPKRRLRMMYRAERSKGWSRRIAAAVAVYIVLGFEWARRYLVVRDWSPAKRPA